MFTKAFWKDLAERALSTFLQAFAASFLAAAPADATGVLNNKEAALGILLVATVAGVLAAAKAVAKQLKRVKFGKTGN